MNGDGEEQKEDIGLPGGMEPVIMVGSGNKMPKTPDLSSVEGLEGTRRTDPFTSSFGAGSIKDRYV
jgi:hypothetical protein